MANKIDFKVSGIEKISGRIKALPVAVQKKVMMPGVRKGATVIADEAEMRAARIDNPGTKNVIAKNVAVRFSPKRYRRTGDVMYRIGLLGGSQSFKGKPEQDPRSSNPGGSTWYWRLLEFGTSKMKAQPVMRPAMNEKAQQAFDASAAEMERQLQKLDASKVA